MKSEKGLVIFDTMLETGDTFSSAVFRIAPRGIICLLHDLGCDVACPDCLAIGIAAGSANITAVAGTDLDNANDPGRLGENTATTVAPSIPDTIDDTSAASTGLFCKIIKYK